MEDFKFYEADMLEMSSIVKIFEENDIEQVIHFAGYKCVPESVKHPLKYYSNNLRGTFNILETMKKYGVTKFVFSSSATVYGFPEKVPVKEDFPLSAINPYGSTKLIIENLCREMYEADNTWTFILLRYFNPVGAHESGIIGEDPKGIPNNLCPYITQVAVGKREYLGVFGNDYDTPDGTGVRDYIHVVDLAKGHVLAVNKLAENPGLLILNLGTGRGYSVLDMVKAFEKVTGKPIPYKIMPRRPGDIDECYADPTLAEKVLGFKATKTIDDMVRDAMRWQEQNPDGYNEGI